MEDEEQSWRCEQTAEEEEITNRSETAETLTETQAAADRQKNRGEEKKRQTENVCPDVKLDSRLGEAKRNVG